jgi:23S rRNA (pseudouridine1915-N3)-methyltransferase
MKIALLQVGKMTDRNVAGIADLYIARIRKYSAFEVITIPELKAPGSLPIREQKIREGEKIMRMLGNDDYVVILDEKGDELRTVEFSSWMGKAFMTSGKRLVFVIGGPWGFSEELYERADYRLSLSRMTFPHQLVRLLFLEQLYRVFTIIRGEQYHHE